MKKVNVMVTTMLFCIVIAMTSCASHKKLIGRPVQTTKEYENNAMILKLKVNDLYKGQSLDYIRSKSKTAKVGDLPDAEFILGSSYIKIIISKKTASSGPSEIVREDIKKQLLSADDSVFVREGIDLSKSEPFYLVSGEAGTDIFLVWESPLKGSTATTQQQSTTVNKKVVVVRPSLDCSSVKVVCPNSPLGNTSEVERKKREAYQNFYNGILTKDQYDCTIYQLNGCRL